MRLHFQEKLGEIRSEVIRMGAEANELVKMAVDATLHGDLELASRVLQQDDRVDELERTIFQTTMTVVMAENPVAADLRLCLATLGIVGELENIGDDAVKLARRATKLTTQFPGEMKLALQEMGEMSRKALGAALRLFSDYSPELCQEIVDGDREIDSAYGAARARIYDLIKANPEATEHLIRTIEAFHSLEHVADHAVAIAVRMRLLYEQPA
jgi:phosphate transport system protein